MHRYGRIMIAAVALFASAGCTDKLSPAAERMLVSGEQAYARGENRLAVNRMDAFLSEHGGTVGEGRALLTRGLAKRRLGDTVGAKADLATALSRSEDADNRAKALSALGDIAYAEKDMALAENMFRRAVEESEDAGAHVLYMLGCVLQRQGRWAEADRQFNKLIFEYPHGETADNASRRVNARAWTVQAGAFTQKRRADALAERMKPLPATTKPVESDGKLWRLVLVGRFPTYEQAADSLQAVRRYAPDAFVTVTR